MLGSGHEYETYVAKLEAALVQKHRNTVRKSVKTKFFNKITLMLSKAQGNYYDEDAVRANLPNAQRTLTTSKLKLVRCVTVTTDEKW